MQVCGKDTMLDEHSPPCVRIQDAVVEFPKSLQYLCCAARSTDVCLPPASLRVCPAPGGQDSPALLVNDYLKSCSLQDCAFIISLQRGDAGADTLEYLGERFVHRCGIIDVDPKRY